MDSNGEQGKSSGSQPRKSDKEHQDALVSSPPDGFMTVNRLRSYFFTPLYPNSLFRFYVPIKNSLFDNVFIDGLVNLRMGLPGQFSPQQTFGQRGRVMILVGYLEHLQQKSALKFVFKYDGCDALEIVEVEKDVTRNQLVPIEGHEFLAMIYPKSHT